MVRGWALTGKEIQTKSAPVVPLPNLDIQIWCELEWFTHYGSGGNRRALVNAVFGTVRCISSSMVCRYKKYRNKAPFGSGLALQGDVFRWQEKASSLTDILCPFKIHF